ncbi:MAG: AraC family transcriptional regulator [Clostridia bacterium]|nr:AraC family transcriptional regulator [Clostridia bacterium]
MVNAPVLKDLNPLLIGGIKFNAYRSESFFDINSTVIDDAHIHGWFEIYINVSGDISFLHGSSVSNITRGDAVVSHPSDVHHCIYNSSCKHEHFCIWILGDAVTNFLLERGVRGKISLNDENKEKLISLATRLTDIDDKFLKTNCLFEIIALLGSESNNFKNFETSHRNDKLGEILAYIDAYYLTTTGSKEIAKRFFISESTLNRNFKKYAGITVGKLIEYKRLSHAEKLLKQGASVTEACYSSGFLDCSRFIMRFKQKFGVTPLKYKRQIFE